tara:strand:+ start:188 stop:376 length:189 start_codon:yes stop_codon:yes gene_type:complete
MDNGRQHTLSNVLAVSEIIDLSSTENYDFNFQITNPCLAGRQANSKQIPINKYKIPNKLFFP